MRTGESPCREKNNPFHFRERIVKWWMEFEREMRINMERSVLFFDIDGTLLSEVTKKVPDSAYEALAAAK